MSSILPDQMMKTIVRHQFYSKIDWEKCAGLSVDVLDRELGAVLEAIIGDGSIQLNVHEEVQLTKEILNEVREFGPEVVSEYNRCIADTRTISARITDYVAGLLSQR